MEAGDSDADLAALAERLVELREEKRYVEGEIESVSARLAGAVGEGTKRKLGDVEIRVSVARPGLRVLAPDDVPGEFLSSKPDRKLLLSHIQETGEVPSGVEVTEGRPVVFAKLVHSSDVEESPRGGG